MEVFFMSAGFDVEHASTVISRVRPNIVSTGKVAPHGADLLAQTRASIAVRAFWNRESLARLGHNLVVELGHDLESGIEFNDLVNSEKPRRSRLVVAN